MNIIDQIKDGLYYPFNDWKKVIFLGLVGVISDLYLHTDYLKYVGITYTNSTVFPIIFFALATIYVLFEFYFNGCTLNIVRNTIHGIDKFPSFDFKKNVVDGINIFILSIVYYIVPVIIFTVFLLILGAMEPLHYLVIETMNLSSSTIDISQLANIITHLDPLLIVVYILFTIIFLIALLFFFMAKGVLAETSSLKTAFNIKLVFEKIKFLGWKEYVIWWFAVAIVSMLAVFLMIITYIIPFIGFLIALLLIYPYRLIFESRLIGLMYLETKK